MAGVSVLVKGNVEILFIWMAAFETQPRKLGKSLTGKLELWPSL